ncbi:effector-associated domain EAD1-containing protein [Frankia sp. AgW1.1]|nr:effector-associated domain EAD1-containing protein [Frankia sp. AgW1.1]
MTAGPAGAAGADPGGATAQAPAEPPSDQVVLSTLADEFSDRAEAQRLVERAGLVRGRQPGWGVLSAEAFWSEVHRLFVGGAVRGGWANVLREAYQLRPGNAVLAAVARAAGIAGPPSDDAEARPAGDIPRGMAPNAAGIAVTVNDGQGLARRGSDQRARETGGGEVPVAETGLTPADIRPRRRYRRPLILIPVILVAATMATVIPVLAVELTGGGPAATGTPAGVAVGSDGVYLTDNDNNRVRKVDGAGEVSAFAGTGGSSFAGDDGPATAAQLGYPNGVAVTHDGIVYLIDNTNSRVRKIDKAGEITTVAGNGGHGFSGDRKAAILAELGDPDGLAVTRDGTLYISDRLNNVVREVKDGIITTVAGTASRKGGFSGDNLPATQARLNNPAGLAIGPDSALYIADPGNQRVRKVDPSGNISTVAGGDARGFGGDGGRAVDAKLSDPLGVAVSSNGTLYVADYRNNRIRKIDEHGMISTFAGTGKPGFSGDDGPAARAELYGPAGVALAGDGTLYISILYKHENHVRKVDPAGQISTLTE